MKYTPKALRATVAVSPNSFISTIIQPTKVQNDTPIIMISANTHIIGILNEIAPYSDKQHIIATRNR